MPTTVRRAPGGAILPAVCLALVAGCGAPAATVVSSPASEARCQPIPPRDDSLPITNVLVPASIPDEVLRGLAVDTLLLIARYDSTGALTEFVAHARPGWSNRSEAATRALRPYVAASAAPSEHMHGLLVPGDSPRIGPVQLSHECRPQLMNQGHISRRLEELAREPGLRGGQAMLWLKVDVEGRITEARLRRSSGQGALDAALMEVARESRFRPATLEGYAVPVWIQIPFAINRR
jgi:TonB family protein